MAKSYDEHYANAEKQTAEARQKSLDTIDVGADKSIKLAEDTYKTTEKDTVAGYESDYARGAVQRLINERQIAERNANLGLTDSGLNRTQQTAAQLSYANQKGDIDIAKRQALDKLSSDLAAYITDVNNQRNADKASINQYYDELNSQTATEMYNAELADERERWETEYDAAVRLQEAEIEASTELQKAAYSAIGKEEEKGSYIRKNIISRDYIGTLEDNGIQWAVFTDEKKNQKVKYVDVNTGDMVIMDWGQNPYTLDNNLGGSNDPTALAAKKFGVYSTGYQPKGVCVIENGKPVYISFDSSRSVYVNELGRNQNIFKDEDGQEWIWNDAGNKYVTCYFDSNGELVAPDWIG